MPFANAGYHCLRIGETEVLALNDGVFQASSEILLGIPAAGADAMLAEAFRAVPLRITVNAFLVRTARRTVLIDTGAGGAIGDAAGHLPARLAAVGVAPAEIDAILLTHLHVDHIGGLLDGDGAAVFAQAELVLPAAEAAFWLDEGHRARAPEAERGNFEQAQNVAAAYRDRMRPIEGGEAVPGITIEALPGHTPGHSGYTVASGSDGVLIWGDIVHVPAVQFARPEVGVLFDADAAQAQTSRRRILDRAATDRIRVAGMHHEFPCFGHVARSGDAYAFVPDAWTP